MWGDHDSPLGVHGYHEIGSKDDADFVIICIADIIVLVSFAKDQ